MAKQVGASGAAGGAPWKPVMVGVRWPEMAIDEFGAMVQGSAARLCGPAYTFQFYYTT